MITLQADSFPTDYESAALTAELRARRVLTGWFYISLGVHGTRYWRSKWLAWVAEFLGLDPNYPLRLLDSDLRAALPNLRQVLDVAVDSGTNSL